MLYDPSLVTTAGTADQADVITGLTAAEHRASPRAIRALVLLAGTVRPTLLHAGIGRSVLDLPVQKGYSLLQLWCDHAAEIAVRMRTSRLSIRVLIDAQSRSPNPPDPGQGVHVSIERDPEELRGTGGLLRDLSLNCAANDRLLVAAAAQLLIHPLADTVDHLLQTGGDVSLIGHPDGTPSNTMMVRCGCLECVPAVGFHDMKEQALPLIAQHHRVHVLRRSHPLAMPIRTPAEYIAALRRYHSPPDQTSHLHASLFESWQPAFSIVENPDDVHPTARVHDSVVLRGGAVAADAVVVRSVICPGGKVRRGATVVDALVK